MAVQTTKDYDGFTVLEGNRNLDRTHVKQLEKLLLENGNLTNQFPIIVNEKMEVIDGQHRLEALKNLGWPVGYEVKNDLNLANVRAINIGHRNWSWLDYARSFSNLGNENYTRLLALHEEFAPGFQVLTTYCGKDSTRTKKEGFSFRNGDFKLSGERYVATRKLLQDYKEVADAARVDNRELAISMYRVMQSSEYEQKRMVDKVAKYGKPLHGCRLIADYLRALEDIYNTYASDDKKARLF